MTAIRRAPVLAIILASYLMIVLLNALTGLWWAHSAAALIIAAVAVHEGRESWRGTSCDCC